MMLKDIIKFNKKSITLIEIKEIDNEQTLEEFIDQLKLGEYFKNNYLFPMAGAIWSCPTQLIKDYPTKVFYNFIIMVY